MDLNRRSALSAYVRFSLNCRRIAVRNGDQVRQSVRITVGRFLDQHWGGFYQPTSRLGGLITGLCRCGDFLAFAASRCQYSARASHIALWPTSSAKSASLWHASAFMRCWAASSAISLLALAFDVRRIAVNIAKPPQPSGPRLIFGFRSTPLMELEPLVDHGVSQQFGLFAVTVYHFSGAFNVLRMNGYDPLVPFDPGADRISYSPVFHSDMIAPSLELGNAPLGGTFISLK
jgi:hypothetical protein